MEEDWEGERVQRGRHAVVDVVDGVRACRLKVLVASTFDNRSTWYETTARPNLVRRRSCQAR